MRLLFRCNFGNWYFFILQINFIWSKTKFSFGWIYSTVAIVLFKILSLFYCIKMTLKILLKKKSFGKFSGRKSNQIFKTTFIFWLFTQKLKPLLKPLTLWIRKTSSEKYVSIFSLRIQHKFESFFKSVSQYFSKE